MKEIITDPEMITEEEIVLDPEMITDPDTITVPGMTSDPETTTLESGVKEIMVDTETVAIIVEVVKTIE